MAAEDASQMMDESITCFQMKVMYVQQRHAIPCLNGPRSSPVIELVSFSLFTAGAVDGERSKGI